MIAFAQDLDGDGILNYVGIPTYYLSIDCMPSAGIDNQGNIFVSYSSLVENVDQGSQNFRHVHVVKSMDGGTTWSSPKDVTPHDL
jgi:Neuraminidase (sialidase)